MAERHATPRARLTISCLESEWERIREVADLRVVKHALLTPRNLARSMGYRADRHRTRAPINILDFIRQSPQFRIPVNQRRYTWTKRHCRQLWDDILDAGERQDVREHFLGPIMYVAAVDPLNAHWAPFMIYDGQQRLTTITLILKTLSRHLEDDTAPDGFGPDQIGSEYLVNPFGKGDQHYRLLLKAGDAETLLALIHDHPLPAEPSSRITDALAFFETRIKQLGPDVSPLCVLTGA